MRKALFSENRKYHSAYIIENQDSAYTHNFSKDTTHNLFK